MHTMPSRLVSSRIVATLVWCVGFAAYTAAQGLPTKRGNVLVWVALLVLALGFDRPRETLRSFVTTWLPLFGALAAYDILRGQSDGLISSAHTAPQLSFDRWIGGGRTPTEHLQGWLWHPGHPHWWDYLAWGTYQTHFFASLVLAVVLWSVRHRLATRYIIAVASLSWLALATYTLYPAQPPWMVARDGLTAGDITRVVHVMWHDVGVDRAARVFTTSKVDGSKYTNPVAALPSLHAAFPMLIATILWGTRRWLNGVLALYVALMGFSLVYVGEHFVFDVLLGWGYALTVGLVARRYRIGIPKTIGASWPQVAREGGFGHDPLDVPEPVLSRYTALPQMDETRS
jgi:membrane-associated phospholipid phosphatase